MGRVLLRPPIDHPLPWMLLAKNYNQREAYTYLPVIAIHLREGHSLHRLEDYCSEFHRKEDLFDNQAIFLKIVSLENQYFRLSWIHSYHNYRGPKYLLQ